MIGMEQQISFALGARARHPASLSRTSTNIIQHEKL